MSLDYSMIRRDDSQASRPFHQQPHQAPLVGFYALAGGSRAQAARLRLKAEAQVLNTAVRAPPRAAAIGLGLLPRLIAAIAVVLWHAAPMVFGLSLASVPLVAGGAGMVAIVLMRWRC